MRILTGAFETSLNAPGFSISLCNLSAASRETNAPVKELLELFDSPTTAVSWPNLKAPGKQKQTTSAPKASVVTNGVAKSNKGADVVCESWKESNVGIRKS